ncbi:MAG: FAD binding domain-containing protein [Candidatus Tyrphobacter sp.]
MNDFRYTAVESPSSALTAIASDARARFIAGGTTILDLMKDRVEDPPLLVDINALPLRAIEQRDDGLHIGALARMADVVEHPLVREGFPAIAIALEQAASPQLRNMASIGGNLLQRTRCSYFRDVATPCNKRAPGTGCGALAGEHRRQAVLGTSDRCIATHASDLAVALVALDASVHISGLLGSRAIALREFYREPGDTPQVETALEPGELITEVAVPALPYARRSTYVKVRDRAQYDFALASAAVALDLVGGTIREARIALGGVATIPWHAPAAERALAGAPAAREQFERAAEEALAGARGFGQNDFKILLAKRTLVRALEIAAA